jgi:hypothetical protein
MTRFTLLTLVLLSLPTAAAAGDDKAADALITRGLELRREGKSADALEMFQRAHALSPTPRSLGQLGLVEVSLDHWIDAEDHLTSALAAPQDQWVRKNRAALDQSLALAKTHIGQIAFSGSAGAQVSVAGRIVGTIPVLGPVRVAEGNVLVTATAPGFKRFILTVPVQAGMQTPLNIALEKIELPAPKPPAPAGMTVSQSPGVDLRARSPWRTWTGAGLVAAGAGVLAWGIVWIALDGHSSGGTCAPSAPSPCMPVYNTQTAGWILAAAGTAAAAGGGVVLYTSPKKDDGVPSVVRSVLLAGRF